MSYLCLCLDCGHTLIDVGLGHTYQCLMACASLRNSFTTAARATKRNWRGVKTKHDQTIPRETKEDTKRGDATRRDTTRQKTRQGKARLYTKTAPGKIRPSGLTPRSVKEIKRARVFLSSPVFKMQDI
jgi:hypothetical protein